MQNEQESAQRSIVEIDELHLDRECVRLPTDYLKAANASADAKRDLAEFENALEVVESELSKEIRTDPQSFGLDKLTEAAIKALLPTMKGYRLALKDVQGARYKADLAQALVWAMEHKKRALTLLVELHGMGYFAQPKVSKEGREAVDKMMQRRVFRHHREED